MEGDIAAAVRFEKFDASLGQDFGRGDDVCSFCVASECDDRLVLEQEKNVADSFLFAKSNEFLLEAQAGRIINGAELEDGDQVSS